MIQQSIFFAIPRLDLSFQIFPMQIFASTLSSRLFREACSTSYPVPQPLAPTFLHCTNKSSKFRPRRQQQLGKEVCVRAVAPETAMEPAAPVETAQTNGKPPIAYHGQGPARVARAERMTKETQVEVSINLDGTGKCIADTPVGFLNHMLDQIASHGLFDLTVKATGDTWIDDHHTVEDIALALGTAFSQV